MNLKNKSDLKAYSTKELAAIYGVCNKTIKRWIGPFKKDVGTRNGRFYNVAQVTIIFTRLGVPGDLACD